MFLIETSPPKWLKSDFLTYKIHFISEVVPSMVHHMLLLNVLYVVGLLQDIAPFQNHMNMVMIYNQRQVNPHIYLGTFCQCHILPRLCCSQEINSPFRCLWALAWYKSFLVSLYLFHMLLRSATIAPSYCSHHQHLRRLWSCEMSSNLMKTMIIL